MTDRRAAALELAESLLADIEMGSIAGPDMIRRASRLARLLDDNDAVEWLSYEISGNWSSNGSGLDTAASRAATRSGRSTFDEKTQKVSFWTASVDRLQASIDSGKAQLSAATDAPISVSSANPNQFLMTPKGNADERNRLRGHIADAQDILGKIIGAIHTYVAEKHLELRFGAAVETSFTRVRGVVDARVAELVPGATRSLATAFENAASSDPAQWANAATACRRLLKEIADELRPAGPPVAGRAMTDDKYINRLIDWIQQQPGIGGTMERVVTADLEDFGKRIDAFADAGNKGAHASVTQYEASRFISGVYLLVGDILALHAEERLEPAQALEGTTT